jgi:predicted transcriptional regulator
MGEIMPEIKTIYQSSESEIKKKEFVQKLQKNVEDMKKIISTMYNKIENISYLKGDLKEKRWQLNKSIDGLIEKIDELFDEPLKSKQSYNALETLINPPLQNLTYSLKELTRETNESLKNIVELLEPILKYSAIKKGEKS